MPRPKQLLQAAPRVADPASVGLISPNLNGAPLPRLDTTAAIQPAMGMARVGEGVERLGEAATRLYEKKEKADSVTAEMRSAEVLENAYQKIAIRTKEEQDQSKWQSIGEEELNNAQVELDKIPNVPPEAKQAIQHKYNMASLQVRGGLKTKAIEKSFQDADKSADAIVDRAGRTENMKLGVSAIDGMVASGLWSKEVGEDKKVKLGQHVEQTAEERQKQSFLSAAMADPAAALEIANNPKYNVKPDFRAWAQHTARAAVHQQQAETYGALNALVEGQQIVTREQVDAYKEANPKVTDEMANDAKKNVDALNSAAHQQWKASNSDTNISRAMAAIRAYDKKTDPDATQFNALNAWIHRNLVPGDLAVASSALKSRGEGHAAEEKDPQMNFVAKELDNMVKEEQLGKFKTRTIETTRGKNDVGDEVVHTATVVTENAIKKAQAQDARVKIEAHIRAWIRTQKTPPSDADIMREVNRVKPTALGAAFIDDLRESTAGRGLQAIGIYGPPAPKKVSDQGLPEDPGRKAKPAPPKPTLEHSGEVTQGENEGKNPDGRSSNKEAPLDQGDLPNSPGSGENVLLADAPPMLGQDMETRPISAADIKKIGKDGITVIDPDTKEWRQIYKEDIKKKAWLMTVN